MADEHPPIQMGWEQIDSVTAVTLYESLHPDQRPQRDARVAGYAEDMINGRWMEDAADPIMIDWNGNLIDGGHRMLAVEHAGEAIDPPLRFLVIRNCDPRIMQVKDTGVARTVTDSLKVAGLTEDMSMMQLKTAAFIAKKIMHWEEGRYTKHSQRGYPVATHTAIAERFQLQRDIPPAAILGVDTARQQRPPLVPAGIYGFFHLVTSRVDSAAANRWQKEWTNTELLSGGSAIAAVRERLYRAQSASAAGGTRTSRSDRLNADEQLALLIRGWNKWIAKKTTSPQRLAISPRGPLSNSNFPMPMNADEAKKTED